MLKQDFLFGWPICHGRCFGRWQSKASSLGLSYLLLSTLSPILPVSDPTSRPALFSYAQPPTLETCYLHVTDVRKIIQSFVLAIAWIPEGHRSRYATLIQQLWEVSDKVEYGETFPSVAEVEPRISPLDRERLWLPAIGIFHVSDRLAELVKEFSSPQTRSVATALVSELRHLVLMYQQPLPYETLSV